MSQEKTYNYFYKAIIFSFLLILGFLIFQFIAGVVLQLINPSKDLLRVDDFLKLEYMVVISWFNLLFFLPLALIFYARIDKCEFEEIGFSGKWDKLVFQTVLSFVTVIIIFAVYIFVLNYLDFFQITYQKPKKIISILMFALFSGLSEEVVFRGYLLSVFTKEKKYSVGVIWTSLLFALLHVLNPEINTVAIINLFLVGMFLALSTIYTKTLYFALAFHVSFNFLDVLSGFNFLLAENDFVLFVVKYLKYNDLLTGGKGGVTGSLMLTLLLLLLSITFVGVLLKKKKQICKSA